jgi:hypothetical protein
MHSISAGVFFLLVGIAVHANATTEPTVDSIDYEHPNVYREFPDSLGDRAAILAQASLLKGASDLDTIHNVLAWAEQNVKYDPNLPYRWRNYDDMVRGKAYGGCADYSILCAVLLKGAGIPTVWVKTMDVAWIWDFKKGRPFKSWSGHVFLEVYVNGKWSLLNPGERTLYQDYSPKMRILPGNRFAYHKGNDPKAMIVSSQWEEWKEQTVAYFKKLDESLLPVDEKGGAMIGKQAYIIGNSPYYQALAAAANEAGLRVAASFNCQYETHLPRAQGQTIVIETHKVKPIVPKGVLERYYPGAFAGLSRPTRSIRVKNTQIIFVDLAEPLRAAAAAESGNGRRAAGKAKSAERRTNLKHEMKTEKNE